jgi:hypothetical protein
MKAALKLICRSPPPPQRANPPLPSEQPKEVEGGVNIGAATILAQHPENIIIGQYYVELLAELSSLMVIFVIGYWVLGIFSIIRMLPISHNWLRRKIYSCPNTQDPPSHLLINPAYQSLVVEEEAMYIHVQNPIPKTPIHIG